MIPCTVEIFDTHIAVLYDIHYNDRGRLFERPEVF